MGPPRSKKRRPTFRRLLKTSGVKLENKLKNRQLKQQNVAKKQRKEQKKLRQAVKDAAIRMPRPLETYRKRPEEEEDEEFLESLPTDMIEDEDLQQMTAMARHASFITRDLSSCGPVHGGKKRSSEVVRSYEKVPRKMARTEEKEVIHLLPIKDKTGVIPQSVERVVKKQPEEEDEEEDAADQPQEFENEGEPESAAALTAEQREKLRVHKINQRKLSIASLGSAIISDPYSNMKRVKELRGMLMESDPCVAVTVRKLVMVSLMEIFKDITPSYRIRPLTPAEKAAKVKKETQQLREFEEVLVSQYKFYLEDLEQTIKDWKQQKKKRSQAVGFQSYLGLAEVAVRCLCELLLALPHFNFHNNIIVALVPLMNDPVHKWKKAEEKLEKELLEAEASDSKEKKIKLHTETLNIVFLVYFRILKKAQKSLLLPAVLEGLANFAHLINLEFFDDLLNVLQNLIQSGDLTNRESLHCIQTVFTILSGQGDVLNIDPLNFYSQLYRMLLRLHAGAPNDDIIIVLRCLDAMLTRRKKQVTLQRAMAFVKRLSTLSLHVLPNASVGILAASRATVHAFPKCDFLLDNEVQGSGFYLPELDEPEHCNAQNTALWELHTLQRHYHPVVRRLASHLCQGAPSEGSAALGVELSRRSPVELFNMYSVRDMTFNPPVAPPATKKKDRFVVGATLLDTELQRQAQSVLTAAGAEEAELDFYTTHTHIHTEH
ncbi:nucleolar complex protein 3 homolog isoform X2 [Micropterus salmoides]|uniref:nucleolar complex protein 3 homolog isoform X2 n=1 Tax=Micropterus salmoides TaxID=27706 RepID=UPI0018EBA80D|nr:nucleolar complex protein 3 homolog isoform X2 [Micropterus salmoides]